MDAIQQMSNKQLPRGISASAGVRLARTDMKGMLRRGNGRLIFISSEEALTPMASMASMAHYSPSKAMRLSISRSPTESR
jgi:3-oxoacyl-[acyl-carrier protein] reductase